jgi:competence protein ComEC
VLRVTTGKHSVLIPADIEREVEARLVDQYGRQLESTVLVVPHHGSQTSSSPRFLDQVRPQLALLAVGYLNRYQHPHHGVMARYAQRRIAVKSTAMHGALQFRLSDVQISPLRGYREQARRYWHHVLNSD